MHMKKLLYCCLLCLSTIFIFGGCNDQPKQEPAASPQDSTDVSKTWRIGVQMWTFHYVPFVNALDKADSAGVKVIEAYPGQALGGDMKDTFGIRMSADSKAKIKQLLQSKGISIVAMGVIVPKSIAEWKQYFDLAKEFGLTVDHVLEAAKSLF